MLSEESSKMSKETHSQDLNFSLDDCKKAIIDSAEQQWDALLDEAGQSSQPFSAEAIWEMEKKMWHQKMDHLEQDEGADQ